MLLQNKFQVMYDCITIYLLKRRIRKINFIEILCIHNYNYLTILKFQNNEIK